MGNGECGCSDARLLSLGAGTPGEKLKEGRKDE